MKYITFLISISVLAILIGYILSPNNRDKDISDLYFQLKESRDSLYIYKHKYYELQREYLELQSKQYTH